MCERAESPLHLRQAALGWAGLSALFSLAPFSWGVAPGWDGGAPLALKMPDFRYTLQVNTERTLLAVNGTLMRGLELNPNMLAAGAEFVREDCTVPAYRLYSIGDRHPGMVRVAEGGVSVAVEVWSVPPEGLASILLKEPPGLSIGKVRLVSGEETLGVLAEPILCEGQREITEFGGWREYCAAQG